MSKIQLIRQSVQKKVVGLAPPMIQIMHIDIGKKAMINYLVDMGMKHMHRKHQTYPSHYNGCK